MTIWSLTPCSTNQGSLQSSRQHLQARAWEIMPDTKKERLTIWMISVAFLSLLMMLELNVLIHVVGMASAATKALMA